MNRRIFLQFLLRVLAKAVLIKYRPIIVGVTGSVGKSSAKEAIALVLSRAYEVGKTEGNFNNEIGVPLSILRSGSGGRSIFSWCGILTRWAYLMIWPVRYPEVLVLEMGIDRPGDMEYLLSFVPVRIGVVTYVSESHMAFFGSITNISKEKGKLIAALPADGWAVLNADDKRTRRMGERTKANVLTYGFDASSGVRADNLLLHRGGRSVEGYSFKVNFEGKTVPIRLPHIVAKHHIPATLAAVAVGVALKINLVEIASALERFEPLPSRLRLLAGKDTITLIDDTYNASPFSTEAALDVLRELSAPRKVAVLGDMLELGYESDVMHRTLATAVRESGAHIVVTVGKHMRALYEELREEGFSRKQLLWMPDPGSALRVLLGIVRPEDLILIKGSQGMRMETIVEQLLAHPEEARRLLCRQSDDWQRKPFVPPLEWTE